MTHCTRMIALFKMADDPSEYVVQSGDALERIAGRFNTTVADLKKINRLKDENKISIGQKLSLRQQPVQPVQKKPVAVPATSTQSPQEYVVRKGDMLGRIARANGTTVPELMRLNGIRNANALQIGQRLRLPVKPVAATSPRQNLVALSQELHRQFSNIYLEKAILANVNRETGGKFSSTTWQNGYAGNGALDLNKRQKGGYGVFQFTGATLNNYKKWLLKHKYQDSLRNQVSFVKSVYGPSRGRNLWETNIGASGKTPEELADWWYKRIETPQHVLKKTYNQRLVDINTKRHKDFMNSLILSPGDDLYWTLPQAYASK